MGLWSNKKKQERNCKPRCWHARLQIDHYAGHATLLLPDSFEVLSAMSSGYGLQYVSFVKLIKIQDSIAHAIIRRKPALNAPTL
jgi:hypothetical protein